ncbi:MAG: hypothetical protein GF400_09050 [Candidatus Eisenbacteria bacterium]|nr:hypothetical protein [Candidatus Eisenbacteria bacterium]
MKTGTAYAAALVVVLATGTAAGGIIHVPDDYPSIKEAIAASAETDTVLVAPGTYTGPDNLSITIEDRHFVLTSEGGPENTVIDGGGASYAFMLSGIPSTALLEGFTIRNCSYATGGAIHFGDDVNLTIRECCFLDNVAEDKGGAVYSVSGTAPVFEECRFGRNQSGGAGGAVYIDETGAAGVTFRSCVFTDNAASAGGAIYSQSNASIYLVDCGFAGNLAEGSGGAIGLSGYEFSAVAHATSCSFVDNHADYAGGALYTNYGGIDLHNCYLADNSAGSKGGAVRSLSWAELEGCTLVGNTAGTHGGALWLSSFESPPIVGCTFVSNASPLGGGVWFGGGAGDPVVENTVIAFSTEGAAVSLDPGAQVHLSCCDLYGNAGGDWTGAIADQLGQNGNISEDPLFCMETSSLSPWTLQSDSPCAPGNSGACGLIGAWPVDCTPTLVESRSWGQIKAMYR